LLVRLGVPATVFACPDLAGDGSALPASALAASRAPTGGEGATMDWDGLRALADRGVEVGSHSCSHARLTDLSDGELRRELSDSRQRLEDELGRPCSYVAYPFGAHDARVRSAARATGYVAAFAQAVSPRRADVYCVRRVSIYRQDSTRRMWFKASVPGQGLSAVRLAAHGSAG
jgi:peptidoglycan/xylan/chitin deacetylase (PgdA/CDA1 family)